MICTGSDQITQTHGYDGRLALTGIGVNQGNSSGRYEAVIWLR